MTGQSSAVLFEAPDPRLGGRLPEHGLPPANKDDAEDDPASDLDEAPESGSDALPEWRLRINVFQFQVRVCNPVERLVIAAAFVGLSLRGVPTPCRNAITERNPGCTSL